jgi:hypothetical protein
MVHHGWCNVSLEVEILQPETIIPSTQAVVFHWHLSRKFLSDTPITPDRYNTMCVETPIVAVDDKA